MAWIGRAVDFSTPKVTEVQPIFAAYCRVDPPDHRFSRRDVAAAAQAAHDEAVVDVLRAAAGSQTWWLGYLEYGLGYDLVFDDAPRTSLFTWDFVLVQAGPEQALGWRSGSTMDTAPKGALPELIFPVDRAWMLFTSWDNPWSAVGGPEDLISAFERDSFLGPWVRRLEL